MFNATSSGLVRLAIGVGAVAVGILLLFAALVRAAELDRFDALVNSPMTQGCPAPETSKVLKDERRFSVRRGPTYLWALPLINTLG